MTNREPIAGSSARTDGTRRGRRLRPLAALTLALVLLTPMTGDVASGGIARLQATLSRSDALGAPVKIGARRAPAVAGILVGLEGLADWPVAREALRTLGVTPELVLRALPVVYLPVPSGFHLHALRAWLLEFGVEPRYVEPNRFRGRMLVPNDPELDDQWGIRNTGQTIVVPDVGNVQCQAGADLGLVSAWDAVTGTGEIVVAVVDDSLDVGHPDLRNLIWLNAGELVGDAAPQVDMLDGPCPSWSGAAPDVNGDGTFNIQDYACDSRIDIATSIGTRSDAFLDPQDLLDNDIFEDGSDNDDNGIVDDLFGVRFVNGTATSNNPRALPSSQDGHGTAVAGCIGAMSDNGEGIAGPNWRVRLLPIAFDFSVASELAAFQYALDKGARIVNASWGGPEESIGEIDGVLTLAGEDVLLVASAGNSQTDNDILVYYPSAYPLPNVLAVAALAPDGDLTEWSQFGQRRVDIAAPGEHILTTMPLGTAAQYGASGNANALYDFISGTSFSSPYAAGVAALVAAAYPGASARELKARLLQGAESDPDSWGYSATDGWVDAAGAIAAATAPVVVVNDFDFIDGDDNEPDRGDTGQWRLRLENVGTAAPVTAVLSSLDAGLEIVQPVADYGTIATGAAAWPVSGFVISLSAALPAHASVTALVDIHAGEVVLSRRLRLEVAALLDDVQVSTVISRDPQDDVHVYHIAVPEDATRLRVSTDANDDIDLIVWHGGRAITTAVTAFYSESFSGDEVITVNEPAAGVWYAHVFNYDAEALGHSAAANTPYKILANLSLPPPPPPDEEEDESPPPPSDGDPTMPTETEGADTPQTDMTGNEEDGNGADIPWPWIRSDLSPDRFDKKKGGCGVGDAGQWPLALALAAAWWMGRRAVERRTIRPRGDQPSG